MKAINEKQMLALFRGYIKQCGGISAAAKELGVSVSFVGGVSRGTFLPGPIVCEKLGLKHSREIKHWYERVGE